MMGSVPKQRSVLSMFGWATECLKEWMNEIRPALARGRGQMLWPTERGGRVAETRIEDHVASIRRESRPAGGADVPLLASLLCHPPHRGRVQRPLRPEAGFIRSEGGS